MSLTAEELPESLSKKGLSVMKEIAAHIGSKGDPTVMESFKEPPSTFVLMLITAALCVVFYVITGLANYYEIKNNWEHYRCMPSVAPFAKFYGHDLAETMNFCMSESVKAHAPGVIDPIYRGINIVTGVVDGVLTKVGSIERGISGLLRGFQDFILNFISSFRLIGTRIRMSFIRIKDIFARVYGIFIAFAYTAISAITFGSNLVCNPLVVFLGTITGVDICCFAPDTGVRMADGSVRSIAAIRIGDRLAGGSTVCSFYRFDGADTQMVRVAGVHVSANHYLWFEDSMIPAGDHPEAEAAEQLPELICLGTTNNLIPIVSAVGTTVYADYEESSDPAVIAEAQRVAEMTLNGYAGPVVPDYSLGLDPTLLVLMEKGVWKPLASLEIGDVISGGDHVVGVIREVCKNLVRTPGGHLSSAAQLIHHEGRWIRACYVWAPSFQSTATLYHIMTKHGSPIVVGGDGEVFRVRDYAEITSLDIQAPYDRALNKVDRAT